LRLFVLIISLFLYSCASEVENEDLVGAWELLYDGQGDFWFSHVAFTASGEKCTISYSFDKNKELSASYYLSSYNLENNELTVKVVQSSSPYVNVGEEIKDKILNFNQNTFAMKMYYPIVGSSVDRFIKLEDIKASSICSVVKNNS
jgi:hypothetical protein